MDERTKAKSRAMGMVKAAMDRGDLVRPGNCELCDRHEDDRATETSPSPWKSIIVAHHHQGYSRPLDIWWVCQSCNVVLGDRTDLTKDEARKYIAKQLKYRKERKKYYKIFYTERQRNAKWRSPSVRPGQFDEWLTEQGRADLAAWATTRKPYNCQR